MQAMRDILRTSLARSLETLTPLDRLGAAWTVAAGHAVASRSSVTGYQDGVATITVPDFNWQRQLEAIHGQLRGDLASISKLPLTDILFVLPETTPAPPRPAAGRPIRKKR